MPAHKDDDPRIAEAYDQLNARAADDPALAHSMRFRRVSTRYPRRVAEAYGLDIGRAAGDSDEQVAATVAAWERAQGWEPVDWWAIGAEERDED